MKTIRIPQANGVTRYVALSDADAAAVRADRTMIDAVRPLAILDLYRDDRREWPVIRSEAAQQAIRDYIDRDQEEV